MRSSKGWLQGIQYFRAFAIIEVIALHTSLIVRQADLTVLTTQKEIIIAFAAFTSFAVAHFLFISGVVLYNKYDNGFPLCAFYQKRFSTVLPPYLIWSTLYFFYPYVIAILLFSVFHHPTATYSSIPNVTWLTEYLKGLVVGISELWFIVLLMQLYLLYPLLVKFYNRFTSQRNPIYVLSFLLLVQTIWSGLFLTTGPTPFRALFLTGIFYFVFGFFISEHYEAVKQKVAQFSLKSISLAVLLATLYYAVVCYHTIFLLSPAAYYVWLYQITGPFYCLLLISFYLKISMGWGDPRGFVTGYMEKIGEDSFGMYLTHIFFITLFALALPQVGLNIDDLPFYPILFFLTLIASYLSVQVLYHAPLSNLIIGTPRKNVRNRKGT